MWKNFGNIVRFSSIFWSKKRPLWNKKRPFFFCFSSLCMFFFQGKFTLFYGFFQYTQTGGLKWWHNLSSRKNKLQIGLKILRFKWRIVIMLGEEIVLQISSSCLSLSSFLFVDFFFVNKTVTSFYLTLFHKNSQILLKNAKFGTNFGKPVKKTLPQFCKQSLVGEICLRFFFHFTLFCFHKFWKNILAKNLHGYFFSIN